VSLIYVNEQVTVQVLGKSGLIDVDSKKSGDSLERLVVVTPDLHPQIGPLGASG